MHKTNPNQKVRILTVRIAVDGDISEGEIADEISALLTESGIANSGSAILDWQYVGWPEGVAITTPDHPMEEGAVFALPMTTVIDYQYADADNFKTSGEVLVAGVLSLKDIIPYLDQGEFFIPNQVGIPDIQAQLSGYPNDSDHVWHTIRDVRTIPGDPPKDAMTAEVLRSAFITAADKWDVAAAMERHGLEVVS